MNPKLITISGNIAVGKTTFGPLLAKALDAVWLPEDSIFEQFMGVHQHHSTASRFLSQASFTLMRQATAISKMLEGDRVVVAERGLWDAEVFEDYWLSKQMLSGDQITLLRSIRAELGRAQILDYSNFSILLKAESSLIERRVIARGGRFDSMHSVEMLRELQCIYESKVISSPPLGEVYVKNTEDSPNPNEYLQNLSKEVAIQIADETC